MENKPTILLVDDEKEILETLGSLLVGQEYNVIFAKDGIEGLEKAKNINPDLILLDVVMPYMDGFNVCRALRDDPLLKEIPIILMTGLNDKLSRLNGIQAGADDFIVKPFDYNEMLARVKTIIRLNRYRRLHEERTKFKKIVDMLPEGMIIIDRSYKINSVNRATKNLLGFEDEESLIDRDIVDFISKISNDNFLEKLEKAFLNEPEEKRFEAEFIKQGGGHISVEISIGNFSWEGQNSAIILIHDITQRKNSEEALRESETRFRSVSELISDLVYTFHFDEEGTIIKTWYTDSIVKIFGYTYEELLQVGIDHVLYPLDKYSFNNHVRNLISGKGDVCEFRIINSDGEVRWLKNYGKSLWDTKTNKIISLSGALQDITQRVMVERALQESETRYRMIVESQTDLICKIHPDFRLLFVNREFCKFFKRKPNELIGENFLEMIFKTEDHKIVEKIKKLYYRKNRCKFEYQVELPDKEIYWLEWIITATFDLDGSVMGYQAVGIDITDRKKNEVLLKESEEKYRRIFEESKDTIFIATIDGTIIETNPSGYEMLGYKSKEEFIEFHPTLNIYVDQQDPKRIIRQLKENGYVRDYEMRLRKRDGTNITVTETATPVYDSRRNTIAYRGVIRNITDVKQLESELLESQKMESIGRLVGGIAHDFNNMLTIIIGHADLARAYVPVDNKGHDRLLTIQQSAERAASFVKQLLAFSRKQVLQLVCTSLNDIIKDFSRMLHRVIGEDITLKICTVDEILIIKADVGQIYQVLLNLAINARDAMPNGGELVFESQKKTLSEEYCRWHPDSKPGEYAVISVSDTGVGIEREIMHRIFEPFFTTKKINEGTGLGLSVVYGIVKQHGGFVNLYSETGKGTIFNVYLPIVSEGVDKKDLERKKIKGGTETILLVEDEDVLRNIAMDALNYLGYKTYTAKDGLQGIEIFKENNENINLVLIDVVMPKLGGREAVEEMKKINPNVKYLFTTGYSLNAIHTSFILEQKYDVIQKPWSMESLAQKIRDALEK